MSIVHVSAPNEYLVVIGMDNRYFFQRTFWTKEIMFLHPQSRKRWDKSASISIWILYSLIGYEFLVAISVYKGISRQASALLFHLASARYTTWGDLQNGDFETVSKQFPIQARTNNHRTVSYVPLFQTAVHPKTRQREGRFLGPET